MKISIITVCFNSAETIRETIDSVINQTYENIEYIIVDGGSEDGTIEIISEYKDYIEKVVSEQDHGIYDAMNKGIKASSGDIVGILNSDDFYAHNKVLETVANIFLENKDSDLLIGNVEFFSPPRDNIVTRRYSARFFYPWMLRFGFCAPHPSSFFKKRVYEKIGLYNKNLRISADFDFFVRFFIFSEFSYKKINESWVKMRSGGASGSGVSSYLISNKEILKSLKKNNIYSNYLFVAMRLPIKVMQSLGVFFKRKG